MSGEKRMLLDWGNGILHLIASDWESGMPPWNVCGTGHSRLKPQVVYWTVSPKAVSSEMCKRCLKTALTEKGSRDG